MLNKKKALLSLNPVPNLDEFESRDCSGVYVIGVDEVGAGCLAGPLVVAGFGYFLDSDWVQEDLPVRVIDSKVLSEKRRQESEEFLLSLKEAQYKIVEVPPEKIDEINIYQARMWALAEAAKDLARASYKKARKILIFVDGPVIPKELETILSEKVQVVAESKGDRKYFPVAAASIIAKNYRDRLMSELAVDYPEYRWESNVGYPTPEHKAALRDVGESPWHRRSFKWA